MALFVVGKILKSFGIKGFVKVQPLTHSVQRFERLKKAFVGRNEENATGVLVDEVNVRQKDILVKLHGVDDRTNSEGLAGQLLFVDEENLLPPPKGSYFVHDIIGCAVWTQGKQVGTVVEVYAKSQGFAQDVWVVEETAGLKPKRYWLPAVPALITEVDVAGRRIVVEELFNFSD